MVPIIAPAMTQAVTERAAVADRGPALRLAMNQAVNSRTASVRKKIHLGNWGVGEEGVMGASRPQNLCAGRAGFFQPRIARAPRVWISHRGESVPWLAHANGF